MLCYTSVMLTLHNMLCILTPRFLKREGRGQGGIYTGVHDIYLIQKSASGVMWPAEYGFESWGRWALKVGLLYHCNL